MTDATNRHWTDESTDDYLHAIASGFARSIESAMGDRITQSQLAERLGVSESRVSQVLNNPGNLTLRKIIEYARALQLNVAIVSYEGTNNRRGLVSPEIFEKCWAKLGKPRDFFEFDTCTVVTDTRYSVIKFDIFSGGHFVEVKNLNLPSKGITTPSAQQTLIFISAFGTAGPTGPSSPPESAPHRLEASSSHRLSGFLESNDG